MFSFLRTLLGLGPGGARVSPDEAQQQVGAGAALVDVRTTIEFADGHIDGSINIPVADLRRRMGEIDASRGVVLYCRSGARSARAAGMLRKAGIEGVYDLGPMSAWPAEA